MFFYIYCDNDPIWLLIIQGRLTVYAILERLAVSMSLWKSALLRDPFSCVNVNKKYVLWNAGICPIASKVGHVTLATPTLGVIPHPLCSTRRGWSNKENTQKCWSTPKLWPKIEIQDGGRPPSWIFENLIFEHWDPLGWRFSISV